MAEYLELEKVLDDRNIITVQTKEYGSIDVIPVDTITDVPLADVQPVKHGRWIWDSSPEFGNPYGSYVCSECDERQAYRENYCPNCGARMDLKEGE